VSTGLESLEPAIVDVHVTALRAGSIIVNADVLLSTSMDATLALNKVQTALETFVQQSDPPAVGSMPVDMEATTYQVMECGEEAPPAPANGLRSVPEHKTTGTRAVYSCDRGYAFSDGVTESVTLVCGHATRQWGVLNLECERPRTTTVAGTDSTTIGTTPGITTTTEEPEPDFLVLVTLPTTACLLLLFALLIFCVRIKGGFCSLLQAPKKNNYTQQ